MTDRQQIFVGERCQWPTVLQEWKRDEVRRKKIF